MSNWSWKEGLRFAFAKEFLLEEGTPTYKMNIQERIGTQLLRPLYRILELVSKNIRQPLAICFFTFLAALTAIIIFYNIPALVILGKLIPFNLVRFLLFLCVELNLFAIGCRAFGRFNNVTLVNLWKKGQLQAVFPGDWEWKS